MSTEGLTQSVLHKLLHYNPDTGIFTWKVSNGRSTVGKVAGSSCHGYVSIGINTKIYLGHRLAVLYMTGGWPAYDVDHINGNRADNRWVNLRQVTRHQNCLNRKRASHNKSGVKGVSWDTYHQKWRVSVTPIDGHVKLMRFGSLLDAVAAAMALRKTKHGAFSNNG